MAAKEKVPTVMVELVDKKGSGFILDGTEGTKYEVELNCPSVYFIPSESFRYADKIENGKTTRVLERIRFQMSNPEISLEAQDKAGWKPQPRTDKIMILNGTATFAREGANIGTYDYITQNVQFNASNPDLLSNARPIYKVVDLNKLQEEKNESELVAHEARSFVYSLQEKKAGVWIYQTERIDALCELFNVYAELPSSKIEALAGIATRVPDVFLNKVVKFEQTVTTLVAHALQLNVIKFDGNTAAYIGKNKIIKNLGAGKIGEDEKVEMLATYLRTKDGYEAKQELEAEVGAAKEKKADS